MLSRIQRRCDVDDFVVAEALLVSPLVLLRGPSCL
jgi:hypothetical protein